VVRFVDDSGAPVNRRTLLKVAVAALCIPLLTAHVGSPNVFFSGKAGPYDIKVVVRPPEVVPGIARVTVRAGSDVQRVSIRPVFWRAGSKGAPSADETTKLAGDAGTFEGSLWLMARGAYSVDVIVAGSKGDANVLVPVAAVATGRLAMNPILGALLAVLGVFLVAGLVNIVYKAAGESLVPAADMLDDSARRKARRVAALALPVLALAIFGGARWWRAVDRDYDRTIYRPAPLQVELKGSELNVAIKEPLYALRNQVSLLMPDHGKMMHLFLVKSGDARAFAHLHPIALDSTGTPKLRATLPQLPAGTYHVYGDVVHETGFERTLVGTLAIPDGQPRPWAASDADDAWFVGDPSTGGSMKLPDGSTMQIALAPQGELRAGVEQTIRVSVVDGKGAPARLEAYLGMPAHGVVSRLDGSVYVHLHPMGTITMAAQDAFAIRDRGDTTKAGRLRLVDHSAHVSRADTMPSVIEFPYEFPKGGDYRIFVQVRRAGRVHTGAFAVTVADSVVPRK
jgi:hypothetical protein